MLISTLQITPRCLFQSDFTSLYFVRALNNGYFLCNVFSLDVSWSRMFSFRFLLVNSSQMNPQLHCTPSLNWTLSAESQSSERTHRERLLQHLFYCCLTAQRTRMLRTLHSNGCLQSRRLTLGLYATIWDKYYTVTWYRWLSLCARDVYLKIIAYIENS
jgi:hypothetical protein